MRNKNKSVLIIEKITFQPCDMLFVEIIGWLIQKKNIRFLQQQLAEEHLGPLTTAQVCHIPFKSQVQKPKCSGNLLYFCIDHIKIMQCQFILDRPEFFHKCIHLFFICTAQKVTDFIHPLLFLKKRVKRRFQNFLDRHPFLKDSMLIQISCMNILCPFYLALIRHQFPCNNTHKSRLTFAVGPNKSDMLSFQESERNICKNGPVAKPMCQMFYI